MSSPPKQDPPSNMHIEETRPVSGPRRVDEIEEAKEVTLNEVCPLSYEEFLTQEARV